MSKFDDIFSRKVKEAFDNYNADHLEEDGWNAYVTRYGRRRSRKILIPLWARAASIIVLVTAGVLFINRFSHQEAEETASPVAQETGAARPDSGINETGTIMDAPVIAAVNPERTEANTEIAEAISETGSTGPEASSAVTDIAKPDHTSVPGSRQTGQSLRADESRSDYLVKEPAGPVLADADKTQESLVPQNEIATEVSAGFNIAANPLEIRLTDEADVSLNLKPRKTSGVYYDLPRERMETTIMTGLSGMMASVDNATSISQGVSIGFYVEQQLSRRISVRPGLAMARHNYAMEGMPGGTAAMDYTAPELNGMDAASTSYDADIDVVSMEVPVNFVFSVRKRTRSNLFVSTGASTVIYLSQHLTGTFNNTYAKAKVDPYGGVSYEYMSTSVRIERDQEFFSRVDLLGLANFSAGYSFPFAGTSQLLFEPFVQLPIRDLTSLNLRIRYGGLSMKIKF
ncbi:MAG: PorT family protein [Bacteroidales bacterium]|jgi:hypothetical protein|nr:PorT family protein [Bacteroidales bacterium]